jgi:hypothetical protein
MSKLVLLTYRNSYSVYRNSVPDYKKSMLAMSGQKVFIYGEDVSVATDDVNEDVVIKHFGFAKTLKRNKMAVNHVSSINGVSKGAVDFTKERIEAIEKLNKDVAEFFLKNLHNLTWDNYDQGVLSTIPFDEAYELLVPAMKMIYEILAAGIEDKYSQELSVAEMTNSLEKHNLLVDQTLGKNIPKSKRKDSD